MNDDTISPMLSNRLVRPAGHYSHAMRANGFLFVSGQLPTTRDGQLLTNEPFEVQARQVLDNIKTILEDAELEMSRLVRVTVYIAGVEYWGALNSIYAEILGEHRPARTVVPVPNLHHGVLIEMDAIAAY